VSFVEGIIFGNHGSSFHITFPFVGQLLMYHKTDKEANFRKFGLSYLPWKAV
jgi:hypothetical protein